MKVNRFPARLHVILARESNVALIIRRGPSKSVCTILWERNENTFKLGQWLRGRIYERRCDLSPDGQHFIYFAMNGRWESETKGSWTAISRTPYLKAVKLLPMGDCWYGGGLFLNNHSYWLNGVAGCHEIKSGDLCAYTQYQPSHSYGDGCSNVYFNRLQRDGWEMLKHEHRGVALFVKKLPKNWTLRKLAFSESGAPSGKSFSWDAHELKHEPTGTLLDFPKWEWADYDHGRLVWAIDGQLRTARLEDGKLGCEKLLHDFNDMKFEALKAPY